MIAETQEIRNVTIGAAVTPTEKRYAEIAAKALDTPLSQLLRTTPLDDLISRGKRIYEAVHAEPTAA